MGTIVAGGDMLFVATQGSTEPWLPPFETVLEKHDTDDHASEYFHAQPDDPWPP